MPRTLKQTLSQAVSCGLPFLLIALFVPSADGQGTQRGTPQKRPPIVIPEVIEESDPPADPPAAAPQAQPRRRRPAPPAPPPEEPETPDEAPADEPPPPTKKQPVPLGKKERPAADPLRVPVLAPALEQILKNWEVASSKIDRLEGKHSRVTYESVFQVEKHAKGKFLYEAPDAGVFTIEAVEIPKGAVGNRFQKIVSDAPERWICNGKEMYKIDDVAKTYNVIVIPPENRGENITDGPLPFLFGMKAEKAKMRYDFTLIKETDKEVWLGVKPLRQQDAANWQEAKVIINVATYLPRAVQLVAPGGNQKTVHTFDDLKVNKPRGFFQGNPLKPSLAGYKPVVPNPIQANQAPGNLPARANIKPRAKQAAAPPVPQGAAQPPPRMADSSDPKPGTTKKKRPASQSSQN